MNKNDEVLMELTNHLGTLEEFARAIDRLDRDTLDRLYTAASSMCYILDISDFVEKCFISPRYKDRFLAILLRTFTVLRVMYLPLNANIVANVELRNRLLLLLHKVEEIFREFAWR